MKGSSPSRRLAVLGAVALLVSSWPAGADTPNLAACKSGSRSCRASRLTLVEMTDLAVFRQAASAQSLRVAAEAGRDRTERARRQLNLERCLTGREACDSLALSAPERVQMDTANRARNDSDCSEVRDRCEYGRIRAEPAEATAAERTRNQAACRSRLGWCNRAGLTTAEADAIPAAGR